MTSFLKNDKVVLSDIEKRTLLLRELGSSYNFSYGNVKDKYFADLTYRLPKLEKLVLKHQRLDAKFKKLPKDFSISIESEVDNNVYFGKQYANFLIDNVFDINNGLASASKLLYNENYFFISPKGKSEQLYFNVFSRLSLEDLINIVFFKNVLQFYDEKGKFYEFPVKANVDLYLEKISSSIENMKLSNKQIKPYEVRNVDTLLKNKSKAVIEFVLEVEKYIKEKFPEITPYETLLFMGRDCFKILESYHYNIEKNISDFKCSRELKKYNSLVEKHKQPLKIKDETMWQILIDLVATNFKEITKILDGNKKTNFQEKLQNFTDECIDEQNFAYKICKSKMKRSLKNKIQPTHKILEFLLKKDSQNQEFGADIYDLLKVIIAKKEDFIEGLSCFSINDLFYLFNITNSILLNPKELSTLNKEGELGKEFENYLEVVFNKLKPFNNEVNLFIEFRYNGGLGYTQDEVAETLKRLTNQYVSKEEFISNRGSNINLGKQTFITLQRMFPDREDNKIKAMEKHIYDRNLHKLKMVQTLELLR